MSPFMQGRGLIGVDNGPATRASIALCIPTQCDNAAVVAAWRKLGLQPFVRLNTFHVTQQPASPWHY